MKRVPSLAKSVSPSTRKVLAALTTPERLQSFIDEIPYNAEEGWFRCPASVLRDGVAHCFEGAVFAAAVLREQGYRPLIVNFFPEPGTDDEHLVAVYQKNGGWGAVAQSNFVGLRARSPIYRTIRELTLSYFDLYFNTQRMLTLRTYTRPLDLSLFDKKEWLTSDETMNQIDRRLDELKRVPLLTRAMIKNLTLVDEQTYRAGLAGANPAGLFQL